MFILVNPHNPTSRVFSKEELLKMCEICLKYRVIIISDEIFSDMVFEPYKHTVTASLSK